MSSSLDEYYRARDIVVDILERDLIGPVSDNEVIEDLPTSYYIAGKLYPQQMDTSTPELEEVNEAADMSDPSDSPVSLANQREPSAMAITFAVKGEPRLTLTASYATYVGGNDESLSGVKGPTTMSGHWQRKQHSHAITWTPIDGQLRADLGDGAELLVIPRKGEPDGSTLVTASLVNAHLAGRSRADNALRTLFQTELGIATDNRDGFADIDRRWKLSTDPEILELDLLYRNAHCYAQGHGCSVVWDMDHDAPRWIRSSYLPQERVRQMKPRLLDDLEVLGLDFIAHHRRGEILSQLGDFACRYERWIDAKEKEAEEVQGALHETATHNMKECRCALARIRNALDVLARDDVSYEAFRLANEAMLLQRRCVANQERRPFEPSSARWYPFQLAFILQEVTSFTNPTGDDRAIADLLWFPTGGGKTEAYLGIAAFCIFLRRLRNPEDGGVAVIMRYTLRLLTMQQFQRASMLIAACEHIRRRDGLGGDEISIGLWVGGGLTPNSLEDARTALRKSGDGLPKPSGKETDPVQVLRCPWCGEHLSADDYQVDEETGRMYIHCPNEGCEFHGGNGIPAHVVDEAIYRHTPTFIVATVDKFAQLPKKREASNLFGIGNDQNPPDLIIQDELHLITGPLGTMVGLYECAIERLCERDGIRPKVIASTATVRNAGDQIKALYGEAHRQFPPQGLDIDDSYFAVGSLSSEKPDRLYAGLMSSGVTQTTTMVHIYAALLFATRYLAAAGFPEDVVDAYWTIVGYFCTLRELGGALTLVADTVQNRFAFLAGSKFKDLYPGVNPDDRYNLVMELTSRKSSSEIANSLAMLEKPYTPKDAEDTYSFVLATNMISVGVDVARLGVMVVDSQPKSNSEYIQATSRVGRRHPGLVVTAFNPFRSRDRSHYEQFLRFHSSLYRNVESTSLTPFSERARDRGLHAVFVTLCRYMVEGLAPDDAAGNFHADDPAVQRIKDEIVSYVARSDKDDADEVAAELDEIAAEWEERKWAAHGHLAYWEYGSRDTLLKPDTETDRFKTMNSLRSVEPSSNVWIRR